MNWECFGSAIGLGHVVLIGSLLAGFILYGLFSALKHAIKWFKEGTFLAQARSTLTEGTEGALWFVKILGSWVLLCALIGGIAFYFGVGGAACPAP